MGFADEFQPDDSADEQQQEEDPREGRRFVQEQNSRQHRSHGTDARPHRIGRADRSDCVALASSVMLSASDSRNPVPHQQYSAPVASFIFPRQNAKPVSNRPATISMIPVHRVVFYSFTDAKLPVKFRPALYI